MNQRELLKRMQLNGEGMENDGKFWSQQDKVLLIHEFHDAADISEIALLLHRSERAIVQQLIVEGCYAVTTSKRSKRIPSSVDCLCSKCRNAAYCSQKLEDCYA